MFINKLNLAFAKVFIGLFCLLFVHISYPYNFEKVNNIGYLANKFKDLKGDELIIFDIDNVILVPRDLVLRPKARKIRHNYFNELKRKFPDKYELYSSAIGYQITGELVEPEILDILCTLKKKKIKFIALTSMGPIGYFENPEVERQKLLEKMGIKFSQFPNVTTLIINNNDHRPQPICKSGIIFTRGYDKGLVLKEFLKQAKLVPSKIFFIDDMEKNLTSVKSLLDADNIISEGIHYQAKVLDLDPKIDYCIIKKQFDWFEKHFIWLSDRQAELLCKM